MQSIPLSLYIHIPWCVKKCPYCDFNSHALNAVLPEQAYLDALVDDLHQDLMHVQGRSINTIFFGGGTPSLISPQGIGSLLQRIAALVNFASDIEITMEMNPGTAEYHNVADYRAAGVTRISLGAQSFNDDKLKALGRIHCTSNTKLAIEKIIAAGFNSYNIDLMHGLPQQTVTQAMDDLQTALSFNPPHISWYQLTLEPNTLFHKYPPKLPNDEITWEIQQQGEDMLAAAGMQHYEVSAFSKVGHECRHNINYWKFGDYLGIGAGAHSKITNLENMQLQRSWKTRNPKDYLDPNKAFIAGTETVSTIDTPGEYMLNRLRLFDTVDLQEYTQRTGLPISTITAILEKVQQRDLILRTDNSLIVTAMGRKFLNEILMEMV